MFHVSLYFSIYCLYIFLNTEESNLIVKSLPFYELVYNVNIYTTFKNSEMGNCKPREW